MCTAMTEQDSWLIIINDIYHLGYPLDIEYSMPHLNHIEFINLHNIQLIIIIQYLSK